ncbi:MAG TPA: c-type cytochrome [Vicinamibacterales bacterium]|nr:c-type cytochrome [Vicinamibacterales bacterium]
MLNRWSVFSACAVMYAISFARVTAHQTAASTTAQAAQPRPGGWNIPPTADEEKNPLAADPNAIAAGKELFMKTCKRCHGPGGKGDGPDADPDSMQDMDLTPARRASRNPDGVVFYKIWNGRAKPKMPAQKDDLTKDQIWQIVSYVQTLREKS